MTSNMRMTIVLSGLLGVLFYLEIKEYGWIGIIVPIIMIGVGVPISILILKWINAGR